MNNTFESIKAMLRGLSMEFRELHHEPTFTSESAARARGEPLAIGAKAIVMKVDEEFRILVLSAARKIDSRKLKAHFKARAVRFATPEELRLLTGLVPGSVPPFGRPLLNLSLYVDRSVLLNENVAFNAGSLTDSIIMKTTDYIACAKPEVLEFSEEETASPR